ncbi:MAG: MBL fold metallo-hydrolase [candidate division WWE3 bacterium]|nr:MBL fold metallo-hydrolase [candidate division WWE3 bacterium]
MEISQNSATSIRIKGRDVAIVINPTKLSETAATAITIFSDPSKIIDNVIDSFVITTPGEYEVKNVRVYGYPLKNEVIYMIQLEGVSIVYMAGNSAEITKELSEELNIVNVLIIPVSSDPDDLISELEPNIVIPQNFTEESLPKFLKNLGVENVEKTPKLKVATFGEEEEMKVVVLI